MKNSLRHLLVWLVLLALPFQGIASTALHACAHQGMAHAMAPAQHDAVHGHCHDQQEQVPDAAMSGHGHGLHPDSHADDGGCSACAACCMGAALAPAPAFAAAAQEAPAGFDAIYPVRFGAVDLALPERPPRATFA